LVVAVGSLFTGREAAASSLPQLETIEVTESLHASLVLLQEQWLEWLTAYHGHDAKAAAEVLDEIVETMTELGIRRLPDLSLGATVSAVTAARASDFERAAWSLEAAERLDAGRPEVSFAAATIAGLQGQRLTAIRHQINGYLRLFRFPWEREIFLQDALLWLVFLLVLSAALFVALLWSSRGARVYLDFVELLDERLPGTAAKVAALVLLVFPLALPNGLFWLLVWWSIVLWAYASRSEKAVLVAVWLLLGLAPEAVTEQRRRMALVMSSPVRVMENLALSRVEGSTLRDLGNLRLALPDSTAVKHLLADVHQRIGQWEFARALYLDVIDAEPANAKAMVNLGAFYFRVGDYGSAIQLFQRASVGDEAAAAAYFNLSQAYSASYLFDEAEQALRTARQIGEEEVSAWVSRSDKERVVLVPGGFDRLGEIERELEASRNPGEAAPLSVRLLDSGSIWVALVAAILALTLDVVARVRKVGPHAPRFSGVSGESEARGLASVLVPGVAAVAERRGERAVLEIVPPVALLTLPLVLVVGYRIPWGYEPGGALVWTAVGLGLASYVAARVVKGLRA
jgi:tetratricopeptide (TPR) repeat protein